MNESKRREHLNKRLKCVMEEINSHLKVSNIGFFKRRKFIRKLKERMRIHLIITWYPENPPIGAESRTFTVKPMHWTFSQAAKYAEIKMTTMENYLFGLESVTIHPEVAVVKYYNLPAKIIYDDQELLLNFDVKKMKRPKEKSTKPILKRRGRLYVGTHGNNPINGEQAMEISTVLEKLHQNDLNLCNVCKHINTRRIMQLLEKNVKRINEEKEIQNGIKVEPNEYLVPNVDTSKTNKTKNHNYETIMFKPKAKCPIAEQELDFMESTMI